MQVADEQSRQYRPRALDGFVASRYGDSRYLVKDATLSHYMVTNAVGVRVLELADGKRTVDEISASLTNQGKARLPLERLMRFFEDGVRLRLIDPGTWPSVKQASKARTSPYIGIDGVLAWLDANRTWWLNPATKLFAAALVALGLVQLLFVRRGAGLLSPLHMITFTPTDVLMLALPLVFLIEVVLHEFAHAFACHAFGARTRGFAFKMTWGVVPAIVTDTLDAHGIANKYQRMFVSLAGPLVNIASYGIVMTTYHAMDPDGILAKLLLAYSGLPLSMIAVTLNPFLISMDGYWIVADYLEQPNLRKVAIAHLWSGLGGASVRQTSSKAPVSTRVRIAYALYALVAVGWTVTFATCFLYELGTLWHTMHGLGRVG